MDTDQTAALEKAVTDVSAQAVQPAHVYPARKQTLRPAPAVSFPRNRTPQYLPVPDPNFAAPEVVPSLTYPSFPQQYYQPPPDPQASLYSHPGSFSLDPFEYPLAAGSSQRSDLSLDGSMGGMQGSWSGSEDTLQTPYSMASGFSNQPMALPPASPPRVRESLAPTSYLSQLSPPDQALLFYDRDSTVAKAPHTFHPSFVQLISPNSAYDSLPAQQQFASLDTSNFLDPSLFVNLPSLAPPRATDRSHPSTYSVPATVRANEVPLRPKGKPYDRAMPGMGLASTSRKQAM